MAGIGNTETDLGHQFTHSLVRRVKVDLAARGLPDQDHLRLRRHSARERGEKAKVGVRSGRGGRNDANKSGRNAMLA